MTSTYLAEAMEELEEASDSAIERAAVQDGTTMTGLKKEMHKLTEVATARAKAMKRLRKRVMNGGSTTAAETTSDTQAETETETKEGTSIRSQMIKNAEAYLALDEDFERQETKLREMRRARVEESENSQREEVSLVSYSDSEVESIPCSAQ